MREGILIWLPPTERAAPRHFEAVEKDAPNDVIRGILRKLVCKEHLPPKPGLLPWIKMPTGSGSAFFGIAEISAIRQAFCNAELKEPTRQDVS